MSFLKDLSISAKLYLVLVVVIVILVFLGGFGLKQASEINERVDNLYTQELVPLALVGKIKGSYVSSKRSSYETSKRA